MKWTSNKNQSVYNTQTTMRATDNVLNKAWSDAVDEINLTERNYNFILSHMCVCVCVFVLLCAVLHYYTHNTTLHIPYNVFIMYVLQ